jgi:hypothetical protein
MRQICIIFAFAFVLGASAIAADREKVYARQLDCATLKVMESLPEDNKKFQAVLADAVDSCITVQDMASIYKGYKRYEERNPETVRKEREERQGHLVNGALHRIETCHRSGNCPKS